MIAYKFLRADGTSPFAGFRWDLPDTNPGDWVEAGVEPCRSGIHACRPGDLPFWATDSLYEIEVDGEIAEGRSKLVASRGRLLRRIDAWDDELRGAYARTCAERAHELAFSATPPLEDWYAMAEASIDQGAGPIGFVTARIAEEALGSDGHRTERARQAAWLVEQLGLGG